MVSDWGMIAAFFAVAEQLAQKMGGGGVDYMLAQVSPPTVIIGLDSETVLMVLLRRDHANLDGFLRDMRKLGDELLGILNAP
jgi:predicted regulator of Ras-like GTPase activity (Roadblock/LC7/MglB family)